MIRVVPLRLGGSAADQIATSLTSLALTALVARSTSALQFGVFSFSVAVILSLQAFARAVGPETVAICAPEDHESRVLEESRALGSALFVAFVGSFGSLVAATMMLEKPSHAGAALALAVVIPCVIGADARRGLYLSAGRQGAALRQSAFILIAVFGGGLLIAKLDEGVAWPFVGLWGVASGVICYALAMRESRVVFSRAWVLRHSATMKWLVAEAGSQSILNQVSLMAIAALLTVSDLGAIRGALLLFAPLTLISQGLSLVIPAEARRRSIASVRQIVNRTLIGIVLLVAFAVLLLFQPDIWGLAAFILGDTAEGVRGLFVPIGVFAASAAISMVASLALRGAVGASSSGRLRLILGPVNAAAGPIAAILSRDLNIVAWAIGLTQFATCLVWWVSFNQRTRRR